MKGGGVSWVEQVGLVLNRVEGLRGVSWVTVATLTSVLASLGGRMEPTRGAGCDKIVHLAAFASSPTILTKARKNPAGYR